MKRGDWRVSTDACAVATNSSKGVNENMVENCEDSGGESNTVTVMSV